MTVAGQQWGGPPRGNRACLRRRKHQVAPAGGQPGGHPRCQCHRSGPLLGSQRWGRLNLLQAHAHQTHHSAPAQPR